MTATYIKVFDCILTKMIPLLILAVDVDNGDIFFIIYDNIANVHNDFFR